jgi:hypothetical protein
MKFFYASATATAAMNQRVCFLLPFSFYACEMGRVFLGRLFRLSQVVRSTEKRLQWAGRGFQGRPPSPRRLLSVLCALPCSIRAACRKAQSVVFTVRYAACRNGQSAVFTVRYAVCRNGQSAVFTVRYGAICRMSKRPIGRFYGALRCDMPHVETANRPFLRCVMVRCAVCRNGQSAVFTPLMF